MPFLSILTFFKSTKGIIISLIIASILGTITYQHYRIKSLKSSLKESEELVVKKESVIKELGDKIEVQNNSIRVWEQQGKDLQERLNKISFENSLLRNSTENSVNKILNTSVPKECNKAIDWARSYSKELSW